MIHFHVLPQLTSANNYPMIRFFGNDSRHGNSRQTTTYDFIRKCRYAAKIKAKDAVLENFETKDGVLPNFETKGAVLPKSYKRCIVPRIKEA